MRNLLKSRRIRILEKVTYKGVEVRRTRQGGIDILTVEIPDGAELGEKQRKLLDAGVALISEAFQDRHLLPHERHGN